MSVKQKSRFNKPSEYIADRTFSAYFHLSEFRCPCCGKRKVSAGLLNLLEAIREEVGKPILINSGFRCEEHNRDIGGSPTSKHLTGDAADIRVKGVSTAVLYTIADRLNPNGGVGKYRNHVHVDCRGVRVRW